MMHSIELRRQDVKECSNNKNIQNNPQNTFYIFEGHLLFHKTTIQESREDDKRASVFGASAVSMYPPLVSVSYHHRTDQQTAGVISIRKGHVQRLVVGMERGDLFGPKRVLFLTLLLLEHKSGPISQVVVILNVIA